MASKIKNRRVRNGFTLIEIMFAIVILLVVVIGTSGYRYYAALDARKAAMRMTAARIALLLCEGWRGVQGIETHDPTAYSYSDLAIETITLPYGFQHGKLDDFTLMGGYKVVSKGDDYYTALSWKQDAGTRLRTLNIVVGWPQRGKGIAVYEADNVIDSSVKFKLFKLTTCALN